MPLLAVTFSEEKMTSSFGYSSGKLDSFQRKILVTPVLELMQAPTTSA